MVERCHGFQAVWQLSFWFASQVVVSELDPKLAYVQVTHVTPYFEEDELADRRTDFERNHNVSRFAYETPFTKAGKARGEVAEQWKRRTVLTSRWRGSEGS